MILNTYIHELLNLRNKSNKFNNKKLNYKAHNIIIVI